MSGKECNQSSESSEEKGWVSGIPGLAFKDVLSNTPDLGMNRGVLLVGGGLPVRCKSLVCKEGAGGLSSDREVLKWHPPGPPPPSGSK